MLVTRSDQELPGAPFLWAPGTQAWRAVTLELAIPYILVNIRHYEGVSRSSETLILWRDEDVLELCSDTRASETMKLRRVALMLPPRYGSRANWRVRLVAEIWSQCSAGTSQRVLSYFGTNGRCLDSGSLQDLDRKGTLEYPA